MAHKKTRAGSPVSGLGKSWGLQDTPRPLRRVVEGRASLLPPHAPQETPRPEGQGPVPNLPWMGSALGFCIPASVLSRA